MSAASQLEPYHQTVVQLPRWWRYVLIALATVILCSCSAPAIQTAQGQDQLPVAAPPAPPTQPVIAPRQTTPQPGMKQTTLQGDPSVTMQTKPGEGCVTGCPSCNNCTDPYGPVIGPGDEYLCDGGDYVTPAGVKADWSIEGLEEEDAVGHYDTLDGRTIVTPSNRVCIYAPRFAAVRRVVNAMAHEQPVFINAILEEESPVRAIEALPPIVQNQRHAVSVNLGEKPPSLFRQRQQAGGLENLQAAMDAYFSLAPYANFEVIRTGEVSDAEKPLVERSRQNAITLTGDQAPQVLFGVKMAQAFDSVKQAAVLYQADEPDSPRLRLIKLASCGNAQPGEEVEFTLRYDNIGDQVIGNVTVVDNLSTRLEYIEGSAKSSVDANFLTEPTPNGSSILRWEIKDEVKPGDGGILRFRVKVR
jgi:uncharacterized repeat protein (TIGR01451 family)